MGSQPALRLKVFSPTDVERPRGKAGATELSVNSTLSDVFERGFLPIWAKQKQLSQLTIYDYQTSLALWRKLAPDPEGDLHEPVLWELEGISGDRIGGRFMAGLAVEPGNKPGTTMAIGTQRKHARNINKLLRFAGPRARTRHDRKNLSLVAEPTLIESPAADGHAPEGDWTPAEVQQLWKAAARMDSLKLRAVGIDPVLWWRAILVTASHTGLRRGQLLGLSFADLSPPFITVQPARSKRRRGRRQYLSAEALTAIEAIRTQRERIFQWPYYVGKRRAVNVRYLDLQLRKLAQRAGLPENRWFGWNGFRKMIACSAFDIGGEEASQATLGHAGGSSTAMKHYVSGTAQARRAAQIIDQLPSVRPENDDDARQQLLF